LENTPPSTQRPSERQEIQELRNVLLKPDALVEKISPVIAAVLEEQITSSKDDIAQALAPVIGEALRRQVYQAREDIIGRAISGDGESHQQSGQ